MPWIWFVAAMLNFGVALSGPENWYLWLIAGVAWLAVAYRVKTK